ncbi:hypothetical protein [Streptomyces sp. NPDC048845]|uniref:hypothetical protein n=1 Tax=Streptomyces sp. NPDC048845 TaxID=3155390 RepID=UPI003446620D
MTINDLSGQSDYAKSKIFDLPRGTSPYPRWEITHNLVHVLRIPTWPMRRLWKAAALEAQKKPEWIEDCIRKVVVSTGSDNPPLGHLAFTDLQHPAYLSYAVCCLP